MEFTLDKLASSCNTPLCQDRYHLDWRWHEVQQEYPAGAAWRVVEVEKPPQRTPSPLGTGTFAMESASMLQIITSRRIKCTQTNSSRSRADYVLLHRHAKGCIHLTSREYMC